MMFDDPNAAAKQLRDWFLSVSHLAGESLFSIAPEGAHRDAAILDVLKRNARILIQSELDKEGKLYPSLSFFLAAACQTLGMSLGVGHWRAALDNVVHMQQQIQNSKAESAEVGLEIGSPAALFKQQMDEALNQSAVVTGVSFLNKENRQIALGLSINWGMRFLLSYALECSPSLKSSNRKDLSWVAEVVGSLLTTTQ